MMAGFYDRMKLAFGTRLPVHFSKSRSATNDAGLTKGHTFHFPETFLFGAASASHQVEGFDVHSDWWRYERLPGRVSNFAEYGPEAMDRKSDHLAQFDGDVARMKALGLRTYRFSIDWSR